MVFSALLPLKAFAVDKDFFAANDILFYDPSCTANSDSVAANSNVVAIGDSLLANDQQAGKLEEKLKANKYTDVTIDAQSSRFIDGGSVPSGLEAIDTNKAKIIAAGTIIVVLGTNYPGSRSTFNNNVKKFMTNIRALNKDARVFWVNIVNAGVTASANGANSVIEDADNIKTYNYSVVDWHKAVYANGQADTSLLSMGDGGYHQSNPKGINKHVSLILDAIGEPPAGGGTGGSAPITGTDQEKNAAVVWNVLTSKGLSSKQAAGMLGNLQAESGIEPAREQNSASGSITKHMKLDGVTGYGIAQWTSSSRQDGLHAAMVAAGKNDDTDINVQANYLWHELSTGYYKSMVLDPLRKTTTVRAAAVLILLKFEAPEDQGSGVQDDRTGFAEIWFRKFSGLAGTGTTDGTNCACTSDSSGGVGGTKPKILLGPGHTGLNTVKMNGSPAIIDKIYGNTPEVQDAWDVSQIVKTKLEAKGYEVLMTKNSANGGTFQWNRAQLANDNNVDLAFEIHTDSGTWSFKDGEVWSQFAGGYRRAGESGNGQKVSLVASASVIGKSQEYAKKFADARKQAGETGVKSFNGTGAFGTRDAVPMDTSAGNIPLVMLWSKIPWIYNEAGASTSGLTASQKNTYAEGLINGVVASVPSSGGSSSSDCNTSGSGNASAIVDWALKFAWDDHDGHGISDAKPIYKEWYKKYYSGNDYSACNQFVATVMRASGADSKYDLYGTNDQESNYVKKHPEKYTKVTNIQSTKNLQPGDIFFKNNGGDSGHTWLYVGDQKGGNMREAAWHSRPPTANNILSWYTSQGNTTAYRLK